MASRNDDLCLAALVFLQGSELPTAGLRTHASIGQDAVARVATSLADCDANDVTGIRGAVARYRRDGSWRNRQAVIDAVTMASYRLPVRDVAREKGEPDG
jgi:hypothetical protein